MKKGWGGSQSTKRTVETKVGTMNAFRKTGKAKPAQFSEKTPGQREVGFKQKTQKQVTAAMMGGPMPSGRGKADDGPRKDAKRQFTSAPGKRVF